MFKNRITAGFLLAACLASTAHAASSYYVVVPVKGKAAAGHGSAPAPEPVPEPPLDIHMVITNATPPRAIHSVPYSFDVRPYLTVTGDPAYSDAGLTWSMTGSSLLNFSINSTGIVSGAPSPSGRPMGYPVAVTAAYKGVTVTKTFTVMLQTLSVSLAAANLPTATQGKAYSYDFKQLLQVNDPQFAAASNTFSMGGGAPGISLDPANPGVLRISNTVPAGEYVISVSASYYHQMSTNEYTVKVAPPGYSASRFYAGVTMSGVPVLSNEGPGALTITDCKRTPAGGGAAVNCTAKDAWPMSWPEAAMMQAVVPTDTYYVSLSNGQTVVWQPNSNTVTMQ